MLKINFPSTLNKTVKDKCSSHIVAGVINELKQACGLSAPGERLRCKKSAAVATRLFMFLVKVASSGKKGKHYQPMKNVVRICSKNERNLFLTWFHY